MPGTGIHRDLRSLLVVPGQELLGFVWSGACLGAGSNSAGTLRADMVHAHTGTISAHKGGRESLLEELLARPHCKAGRLTRTAVALKVGAEPAVALAPPPLLGAPPGPLPWPVDSA
jgi:hypothetical protein